MIGHKNPDTDSICSAIAYADLRQKVTGQVHEAKRAGHVNDETAYVLDRFGVEAPKLLTDVRLQVRDLDIHEMPGLKPMRPFVIHGSVCGGSRQRHCQS